MSSGTSWGGDEARLRTEGCCDPGSEYVQDEREAALTSGSGCRLLMAATLVSAVKACLRTDTALHLGRTSERPWTRREEHLVGRVGLSVDSAARVISPQRVSQQLLDGHRMTEAPHDFRVVGRLLHDLLLQPREGMPAFPVYGSRDRLRLDQ